MTTHYFVELCKYSSLAYLSVTSRLYEFVFENTKLPDMPDIYNYVTSTNIKVIQLQ